MPHGDNTPPGPALAAAGAAADPAMRFTTCPAQGHDTEHLQIRTRDHWMCGHLLSVILAQSGIPTALAGDRDRLAAELEQARTEMRKYSGNAVNFIAGIAILGAALQRIAEGRGNAPFVAAQALKDARRALEDAGGDLVPCPPQDTPPTAK